ncbi:hypothetical protein [Sphingobium cloacae]|uniref:Exonuclease domain-containing protein n=1 Tax=Sphingobium cloacae TaxID=120107 RepID=A0A1E1EY93_9SPHN|nr:hypothetical protein [Sphingobium cloacae]BAV63236.1 hypothetical protein SCLO_1001960 [Sphingobium cloacae]
MTFISIDFEASCLPYHGRSFPIEVGIACAGEAARSWLIRPHDDWAGWDWTGEAQSLHGLTRERLERDGLPAEHVIAELTAAIGTSRLVADSYLDAVWLTTLADAARTDSPAEIVHIEEVIDRLGADDAEIARAQVRVNACSFVRHRAGGDAQWLAEFIAALEAIVAEREPAGGPPLFNWAAPRPALWPIGIAA